jgi:hypothetical protein
MIIEMLFNKKIKNVYFETNLHIFIIMYNIE